MHFCIENCTHTICAKQTTHNIGLKALGPWCRWYDGIRDYKRQFDRFTLPWIKPIIGVFDEISWKVGWWRLPFLPRDLLTPTSCLQDSLDKCSLNPPNRQVAPWQFRLAPAAGRSTSTVWGWATWRRHLVSCWLSEFPSWDWFKEILRTYLTIIWENTLE